MAKFVRLAVPGTPQPAALAARALAPISLQGFRPPSSCRLLCSATCVAAAKKAARRARPARAALPALVRCAASAAALPPASSKIFFRPEAPGPGGLALTNAAPDAWQGGSIALFLRGPTGGAVPELGPHGEALDQALDGAVREFMAEEVFEAKAGEAKVMQVFGKGVKRVVLVGLGPAEEKTDWRLAGATAAVVLKGLQGGSAGFICVEGMHVQSFTEGIYLGLHTDKRFRGTKTPEKEKARSGPVSLQLLGTLPTDSAAAIQRAQAVATGVVFARELVNGAPNIVNPPNLVAAAENLAGQVGLASKILTEAECEAMGMGSFLAVGRCSDLPAQLIHLTYTPKDKVTRKVGIVGKGLTYDSGGYNLKAGPGSLIEIMKFDMGGAAATLGAAAAVAQLRPKGVEVHFVIAACENMISGNPGSLHPGDIITAMDGTTIEVNNTDAEGRLTLADAMLYTQKQGVTEMVDVATLTGACMIALGQDITGMWSNSDVLAGKLEAAAKTCHEKMWRMPLEEAYMDGLKSEFADMLNTGPRYGGAITAALFLSKFVDKEVQWAHLDIAGTVWADKPKGINSIGGTGCMVRTLTELLSNS